MNIRTEHVFPPIPDRSCDWSAIDSDTYDGAPDSHCPIGRGPTEEAAIADLREQMADRVADMRIPVRCVVYDHDWHPRMHYCGRCGQDRNNELNQTRVWL